MSFILCFIGCSNSGSNLLPEPPDYNIEENWASLPEITSEVDVFYIYPTIYTGETPENMDPYNEDLRANARGLLIAQAGVYSSHANLFAPFYRQQSAAGQSMEANNGGRDAFADSVFRIGYRDAERAFEYYLEHYNNGRPFILAGHSQGSMVIIELLRNKFNDTVLQQKLVAAYAIGYSVTHNDLKKYPWMHPAQGETDTGVIISYNSQGPDAGPSPVLLTGAISINPLNWQTDETPAGADLNKNAIFYNDATGKLLEEVPNFCGAHIDLQSGALIVFDMKTVQSPEVDLVNLGRWSEEVYHRFDYAFFHDNLKENVGKRIDAYLRAI